MLWSKSSIETTTLSYFSTLSAILWSILTNIKNTYSFLQFKKIKINPNYSQNKYASWNSNKSQNALKISIEWKSKMLSINFKMKKTKEEIKKLD